jgi:hypothetical protein
LYGVAAFALALSSCATSTPRSIACEVGIAQGNRALRTSQGSIKLAPNERASLAVKPYTATFTILRSAHGSGQMHLAWTGPEPIGGSVADGGFDLMGPPRSTVRQFMGRIPVREGTLTYWCGLPGRD